MNIDDWFGFFWGMLGFMFGVIFVNALATSKFDEFRHDAVERGVAEYNSETGDWQWKETLQKD
jgi:hypothetical protein|tara:strand:+ start:220 stop:408 length:189 start_codon:yes stop_codon:yes gene_type:complete